MTDYHKLQEFYRTGTDPDFSPNPNHDFMKLDRGGDRTVLLPGHIYSHLELMPIGPDEVPTWDEYEILKNPSVRDLNLVSKYKIKKPYYDNRPIFLAVDQHGLGVNLKVMSQNLRKKFLMSYLRVMETPIERCYSDGKLMSLTERIQAGVLGPFLGVDLRLVKAIIGMPEFKLNLLVNKYNREKMRNLTLVDWDDVPKLPLVNYSTDRMISARSNFSLFEIK
jgi:hypothetical protein